MTQYGLTALQRQVFEFVHAEITSGRRAPSFREIKAHLGLKSISNVHTLIGILVERGWLVRLHHRARSLALPSTPAATDAEHVVGPMLQVPIPTALANRLATFCADRCRTADDVVREALDTHLRWPA